MLPSPSKYERQMVNMKAECPKEFLGRVIEMVFCQEIDSFVSTEGWMKP
jgi:hypothetical protein